MRARTYLLLGASHLLVAALAFVLALPGPKPPPHVEAKLVPSVAMPVDHPLTKDDPPLAKWQSHDFANAWAAMPTAKLATKDRVIAQRELLALWAKVDLEAAIRAALGESLATDGQWYKDVMVNEDTGPLLDALGPALAENPEQSWDLIQRADFGIAAGMLRRLWIMGVAEKDARFVAGKLGDFSARDRDQAILFCGGSLMNQRSNLNYGTFFKILTALPPDQVTAEQLFRSATFGGFRTTDDASIKEAILKTDVNDIRMLRYRAMLIARTISKKSPAEVAEIIEDMPEAARAQTLLSTLPSSKPGSARATGIVDLMIQHRDWASLTSPAVASMIKGGATSEEVADMAMWATGLPVREETRQLFDRGVEPYLRDYPDASLEWIATIGQETWRDRTYARYVDVVLSQHGKPEAARQAVEKMQDGPLKEEAAQRLAEWEKNAKAGR